MPTMRLPPLHSLLALATVALLPIASPRAARADEPDLLEGKRVRVISRVLSNRCAEQIRDAADRLVAVCEDHLPYRLPEGKKLVVRLYSRPQDYRDALKAAGAEAAAQFLTATPVKSLDSYVLVHPRAEPKFLALVDDLPEATLFATCREAVRQFLLRADAPGYEWWPDWYADGMAAYLAEKMLVASAGKDAPPSLYLDDRHHLAKDDAERGRWMRLDRAIHAWQGEIAFDRLRSVLMQWGEFYRLLASEPEKLKALHVRLRDLGKPPEPSKDEPDRRMVFRGKACFDALTSVYGPIEPLEARLREQVSAYRPEWFEPLRSTQRVRDTFVCAAQPDGFAFAIRAEPAPRVPFVLSCEVQILGVAGRQADIYLGFEDRSDPRYLKIQLRPDGILAFLAFADGAWQERLGVAFDARAKDLFPEGAWTPVRVETDGKRLGVDVGGKRVIDADVPLGFDLLGNQVGIGAFRDVSLFRKVEVGPKK